MKSAFMFPTYLATNKIQYRGKTYQKTEELESKRGQIVGPNRSERQTNSW